MIAIACSFHRCQPRTNPQGQDITDQSRVMIKNHTARISQSWILLNRIQPSQRGTYMFQVSDTRISVTRKIQMIFEGTSLLSKSLE